MGDPESFEVAHVFEVHGLAEVGFQEFAVPGPQGVHGEGFAGFCHGVGVAFELSEHGLTVYGGDNIIDLLADEVGAQGGVRGFLHELVGQELFVEGGCDFGFEDGVVVGGKGVAANAVP